MADLNPRMAGARPAANCRAAGIEVIVGGRQSEAGGLNAPLHRVRSGRPPWACSRWAIEVWNGTHPPSQRPTAMDQWPRGAPVFFTGCALGL